mgnify:CR=1 FL=1
MYIVVEGPIGAGKTSLTNLVSDYLSFKQKIYVTIYRYHQYPRIYN